MTWRAIVWLTLVISGIVIFIVQVARDAPIPLLACTALAYSLGGILFVTTDRFVTGIGRQVRSHFGWGWQTLVEVTKPIAEREWYNVYQAMLALKNERNGSGPFGIQQAYHHFIDDDAEMPATPRVYQSLTDAIRTNCRIEQLQYRTLTTQKDRTLRIATNAVFLLRADDAGTPFPFAASFPIGQLSVAAKTEDQAHGIPRGSDVILGGLFFVSKAVFDSEW